MTQLRIPHHSPLHRLCPLYRTSLGPPLCRHQPIPPQPLTCQTTHLVPTSSQCHCLGSLTSVSSVLTVSCHRTELNPPMTDEIMADEHTPAEPSLLSQTTSE